MLNPLSAISVQSTRKPLDRAPLPPHAPPQPTRSQRAINAQSTCNQRAGSAPLPPHAPPLRQHLGPTAVDRRRRPEGPRPGPLCGLSLGLASVQLASCQALRPAPAHGAREPICRDLAQLRSPRTLSRLGHPTLTTAREEELRARADHIHSGEAKRVPRPRALDGARAAPHLAPAPKCDAPTCRGR